jgi:predicted transcriptional regulator
VQKLTPQDRRHLGQNITKHRTLLGLTQENLAEQAAVDRRFIQKIEAGEFGTSIAVLKRLRKALKTSWNDLLRGI